MHKLRPSSKTHGEKVALLGWYDSSLCSKITLACSPFSWVYPWGEHIRGHLAGDTQPTILNITLFVKATCISTMEIGTAITLWLVVLTFLSVLMLVIISWRWEAHAKLQCGTPPPPIGFGAFAFYSVSSSWCLVRRRPNDKHKRLRVRHRRGRYVRMPSSDRET
jgi:hypothetical protein